MNTQQANLGDDRYIWIVNWDRFQHYKDRRPPWIKFYVELLDNEDYLALSEHRALLLHRLWLAFASTSSRLRLDTRSLSRHTFLRVTKADLEALNHAGFIEILDSPGLAYRLQSAMPRARVRARAETEEETELEEERPQGEEPFLDKEKNTQVVDLGEKQEPADVEHEWGNPDERPLAVLLPELRSIG